MNFKLVSRHPVALLAICLLFVSALLAMTGTPLERAHIGMDLDDPAPDFAAMAKSMGWYAEGPIDKPGDIAAALKRAIAEVKKGKPALVDTITQHRG